MQADTDFVIIGALWMLRGAESAALLGEQAVVHDRANQACITLGATKINPAGQDCNRTLRCSCAEGVPDALGMLTCPVHAVIRVLEARAAEGLTGKHPLFPGSGGQACTSAMVRRAICRACSTEGMSDHSLRRMGAQFYAGRGVPMAIILHLGRWGRP
jgi:hypothetical protein